MNPQDALLKNHVDICFKPMSRYSKKISLV